MTRAAASPPRASVGLALAGFALSCAPTPEDASTPEVSGLTAYALQLEGFERTVVPLAWSQPAAGQPWVYRVRVDEDVPEHLRKVARHEPEHSDSWLVLGAIAPTPRAAVEGDVFAGRLLFSGPVTGSRPARRDWFASRALLGPASPDAPCQDRTWDPVEDALALGWPQLPGRLTAAGERWTGARVEGRCNRFACFDPVSGRGGVDSNAPPCVTMSWSERLVGVFALGDARVALIESAWDDGHAEGGVSSERRALVDTSSGRLLLAAVAIHHGVLGIERTIEIAAVDDLGGSLVAAGWSRPDAVTAEVERVHQAFEHPDRSRRRAREAADAQARQSPSHG